MSRYLAILSVPAALFLGGALETETKVTQPIATAIAEEAPQAVRTLVDRARGLRWELAWDAVRVYDLGSVNLLRRIQLPGAMFVAARETPVPGMVLGRTGALVVSSNVQSRVWRVSPARFEVEVYDLEPNADHDKDFGFADLTWDRGETVLLATSTATGARWRLDLHAGRATRLEPLQAAR